MTFGSHPWLPAAVSLSRYYLLPQWDERVAPLEAVCLGVTQDLQCETKYLLFDPVPGTVCL